ncbi:MAG: 23S rRNA (uracil(1939)-C(5))-methyltransferase RlmD [Xanthomonadales bacterium]|nr:23S rRNA (uracil(1939)-C(5))-methyltransferase RlmD [Xanthomonadales bacterium]
MQFPETDITALAPDGRGIATINGKTVHVHGALPGERVRIRYTRRSRELDEARVEELLSASPARIAPRCAHFGTCSGCSLQHLPPEAQIEAKQKVLADSFAAAGRLAPARWLAPLQDLAWGYRRKGRLSVKWVEKKGRVLVGFREVDTRFVADLAACPTLLPQVGERIGDLAELVASLDAKREIPQIEIAAGDDLAALTFRHLVPLTAADRSALAGFGQAHGLAIMLQPGGPDTLEPLWPEEVPLSFRLPEHDVEIAFRPLDFVQVNAGLNRRMIMQALELLDVQPGDRVLDLFCGLGNFTLPLARRAAHVTGVEGEPTLVARARENATRNGIANAEFFAADLAVDQRDTPWAGARYDKLLLDPPRSGAAAVLEYLPRAGTDRIVYVSCHPASLARDASILVERHGFRLDAAGVMDMFPHTGHVESIALFCR